MPTMDPDHVISYKSCNLILLYIICSALSFSYFIPVCYSAGITLAWDSNHEPGVSGYRLYFKTGSSGPPYDGVGILEGDSPIDVGNILKINLNGLNAQTKYYFSVTAYNANGLESRFSKELIYETAGDGPPYDNLGPTADAGENQTVMEKDTVILDGSKSSDPDDGILSYQWTQTEGPQVLPEKTFAARIVFTAPTVKEGGEDLTFTLTVTDLCGQMSMDAVVIHIKPDSKRSESNKQNDDECFVESISN